MGDNFVQRENAIILMQRKHTGKSAGEQNFRKIHFNKLFEMTSITTGQIE